MEQLNSMDQRFSINLEKPNEDQFHNLNNNRNKNNNNIPQPHSTTTNSISTFHDSESNVHTVTGNLHLQDLPKQPSRNFSFSSDKKDCNSSSSQEDEGQSVLVKMNPLNEESKKKP